VAPSSFPFPYLSRGVPNLRKRYFETEVITLPAALEKVCANTWFAANRRLGGGDYFICLQPTNHVGKGAPDLWRAEPPGPGGRTSQQRRCSHTREGCAEGRELHPGLHVHKSGGALWVELAVGVEPDA
jgi:hypothetical protein